MSDEIDSLARRPENAIDAADVVDGVLILKRHDGRELRIGDGSHGGSPSGGSASRLPVVNVTEDRALLPSDIGCLLIGNPISNNVLDAGNVTSEDGFAVGDLFYASFIGVQTATNLDFYTHFQTYAIISIQGSNLHVVRADNYPTPQDTNLYVTEGGYMAQVNVDANLLAAISGTLNTYGGAVMGNLLVQGLPDDSGQIDHSISSANAGVRINGTIRPDGASELTLAAADPNTGFAHIRLGNYPEIGPTISFFGVGDAVQPNRPTTLEEVIAALAALGLTK